MNEHLLIFGYRFRYQYETSRLNISHWSNIQPNQHMYEHHCNWRNTRNVNRITQSNRTRFNHCAYVTLLCEKRTHKHTLDAVAVKHLPKHHITATHRITSIAIAHVLYSVCVFVFFFVGRSAHDNDERNVWRTNVPRRATYLVIHATGRFEMAPAHVARIGVFPMRNGKRHWPKANTTNSTQHRRVNATTTHEKKLHKHEHT